MDDFDLSAYSNLGKSKKKLPGIGGSSSLTGGLPTLAPISSSKTSLVGAPVRSSLSRQPTLTVDRPITSTARPKASLSTNPSLTSRSSGIVPSDSHSQTSSLGASPSLGRPKLNPIRSQPGGLAPKSARQGLKRPQSALPGSRTVSQGSAGIGGNMQLVIDSAEFEKTSTVPWVVNNVPARKSLSPLRSPDSGRGSTTSPFSSPTKSGMAGFTQAPPLASNKGVGETIDVMKQLPTLVPQSLTSPGKPKKDKKKKSSEPNSVSPLFNGLGSSTQAEAPTPPTTNQIVRQHSGRRITKPLPVQETPPPPPHVDKPNSWSLSMAPPISPVRSCVSLKSPMSISRETSNTSIGMRASEGKPSVFDRSASPSARNPSPPQMQPQPPASPDSGLSTPPTAARWTQPKMKSPEIEASTPPRSPRSQNITGSPSSPFKPAALAPIGKSQADLLTGRPKLAPIKSAADMQVPSLTQTNLVQERGTLNGRGSHLDLTMPTAPPPFGSMPVLSPIKKAPFLSAPLNPIIPSTSIATNEAQEKIKERQVDQATSPSMSKSSQLNIISNPALTLSPEVRPAFDIPRKSPFNGKSVLAPISKAPLLQSPVGPIGSSTPAPEDKQPKQITQKGTSQLSQQVSVSTLSQQLKQSTEKGTSQPSQQVSVSTPSRPISIGRRRQTSDFWNSSSDEMSDEEELQYTRQESTADQTNQVNKDTPTNQSGISPNGRLSLASKKLIIVKRHNPNGNGSGTNAQFATIDQERIKSNNLAVADLTPPSCYGRKSLRDLQRSCMEQAQVRAPSESSDDESSKSFVFESPSTHHSYHTSDEDPDSSDVDVSIEEDESLQPLPVEEENHEARLEEYRRKFNIDTKKDTFAQQAEVKTPQHEKESIPGQAEMSKKDLYEAMIATIAKEIEEADAAAEQKQALQASRGESEDTLSHKLTDVAERDHINQGNKDLAKLISSPLDERKKADTKEYEQRTPRESSDPAQKLTPPSAAKETISQPTLRATLTSNVQQQSIPTKSKDTQQHIPEKKSESFPKGAKDVDNVPKTNDIKMKNLQAASETTAVGSRNECHNIQTKSDGNQEKLDKSIPKEPNDEKIPESPEVNKRSSQVLSIKSICGGRQIDDNQQKENKFESFPGQVGEMIPEKVTNVKMAETKEINKMNSQATSTPIYGRNYNDHSTIHTKPDSISKGIKESIPEEVDKRAISLPNDSNKGYSKASSKSISCGSTKEGIKESTPDEVNNEVIPEPKDINKGMQKAASKPVFSGSKKDDDNFSIHTKSDSIPEEIEESIPEEVTVEVIPQTKDINKGMQKAASKPIFSGSKKDDDNFSIQTKSDSIPEEIEGSIPEEVTVEVISETKDINKGMQKAASKPIFSGSKKDDDNFSTQTKSDSIPEEIEGSTPEKVTVAVIPQTKNINKGMQKAASKPFFNGSRKDDDNFSIQTKSDSIPEEIEGSIPEEVNVEVISTPQETERESAKASSPLKTIPIYSRDTDDHHSIQTKSESIPEEIEESIPEEIKNEEMIEKEALTQQTILHLTSSEKILNRYADDLHSIQTKSESIPEEIEESLPDEAQNEDRFDTSKSSHIAPREVFQSSKHDDDLHSIKTKSDSFPEDIEESHPKEKSLAEEISQEDVSESGKSIRTSSSLTSHDSRHQQEFSRSQDASAETDETLSEDMSEDVSPSDDTPASKGKSGAKGISHPSRKQNHQKIERIQEKSESTSYASEIGSHSKTSFVESREHPATNGADIQGSGSTSEELQESLVEETSDEEPIYVTTSTMLSTHSERSSLKKDHSYTRNRKFHSHNFHPDEEKTTLTYKQQSASDSAHGKEDHTTESDNTGNEEESNYALVTDSQITGANSSQLTSLFSSDPNKLSDENDVLEAQRNLKQNPHLSSSSYVNVSTGISESNVPVTSSPSGLSPTEVTSKSQRQQSRSSVALSSRHSACDDAIIDDKVSGNEQEQVTDTLITKRQKGKINNDKRSKQDKEEKIPFLSPSERVHVLDKAQLKGDNLPSVTKVDKAPPSKKSKQGQEKETEMTQLKKNNNKTSKAEDAPNYSNKCNGYSQPSTAAANKHHKRKKAERHCPNKAVEATNDKVSYENFDDATAKFENVHQMKVSMRDADKHDTDDTTKNVASKKIVSQNPNFDQGDAAKKAAQLSPDVLSSWKNDLSEEERHEMKQKSIQSWIITTTESLGEIYHGDSSTGATIYSSEENETIPGQIEEKQCERSIPEMDEVLEADRKKTTYSMKKLEKTNRLPTVGINVDTSAALQSQLISRASQITEVSDPQATDVETTSSYSVCQVTMSAKAAALQSQLMSRASQTTKVSDPQATDVKTTSSYSVCQVTMSAKAAALRSQLVSRASQTTKVADQQPQDVQTTPSLSTCHMTRSTKAAALQSQLISRASQTNKVSDLQVTKPNILTPSSRYIGQPLSCPVTECNELCCRTRSRLSTAVEADNYKEVAPGTPVRANLQNISADSIERREKSQSAEVKIQRTTSVNDIPSMNSTPKMPICYDTNATSYLKQTRNLSYSKYHQPSLRGIHFPIHDSSLPKTDRTISYPKETSFTPPFKFEENIPEKFPHHGGFGLNGNHQHDMMIWRQFCAQVNTDIDNSSKACYKSSNSKVQTKETTIKEILASLETETDDDSVDLHIMNELKRKKEEVSILREKYFDAIEKDSRRVQNLEDMVHALENKLTDQRAKRDIEMMEMQRETKMKVRNLQVQLNKKQHECIMMEVTSKAAAEKDAKCMQDINIKLREMEMKIKLQEDRISQMTDEEDKLKKTNATQREQLKSLQREKSALEITTASLKENLGQTKTEISTKDKEVTAWKEKCNAMAEAVSKFKRGAKNLKKMLQKRDEQVLEMTKKNEEYEQKVTQLDEELQEVSKEKGREETRGRYLQTALDNSYAEQKRLKNEMDKDERITAKVISEFNKMLEQIKEEKKDLETNLSTKTESLKEKAENEIKLQGQKASLEKEVTSLKEKLAEKDELTKSDKQTLTAVKKTEIELREKVERYETQIRESKQTIRNLCDTKEILTRSIASLEFKLACDNTKREAEQEILRRELDDAKSKISKLEKQLEAKTSEISSVQFDLREAQLQIKEREISEKTKDSHISALEEEITKVKEEKNTETKDKLAAAANLLKERQRHQCCVRQMQNTIWALEQSAAEDAERVKALEAESQIKMINQRQEQIFEAPNKEDTPIPDDKPNTDTQSPSTQDQQNMEEKLNNEIKILKDYLKKKIESLYSVEQLAERQATVIEKLKLKLKNIKQQKQPTATEECYEENQQTTEKTTIKEKWSNFYKNKWQNKRKKLKEEFAVERQSMQEEIQDLKQQLHQLQSQQNKNSRGKTSIANQQNMGQASNHKYPRTTKTTSAKRRQLKNNQRRQDPSCPYCGDIEEFTDEEEYNET